METLNSLAHSKSLQTLVISSSYFILFSKEVYKILQILTELHQILIVYTYTEKKIQKIQEVSKSQTIYSSYEFHNSALWNRPAFDHSNIKPSE